MDVIFQTVATFSNGFSSMKIYKFRLKFQWSLFPRDQSTIFQLWFRWWLGAGQVTSHYLNQWWLVYWRIYALLGLNELKSNRWSNQHITGIHMAVSVWWKIHHARSNEMHGITRSREVSLTNHRWRMCIHHVMYASSREVKEDSDTSTSNVLYRTNGLPVWRGFASPPMIPRPASNTYIVYPLKYAHGFVVSYINGPCWSMWYVPYSLRLVPGHCGNRKQ